MSGYIIFPRGLIFKLYASSVLYTNLVYTYLIHVAVDRSIYIISSSGTRTKQASETKCCK